MQHEREGDSDALCSSTDTPRWPTPSGLHRSSNGSCCSSDVEDKADSLIDKTPDSQSSESDRRQGAKPPRRKQGILLRMI